jgi:hypothetical protein
MNWLGFLYFLSVKKLSSLYALENRKNFIYFYAQTNQKNEIYEKNGLTLSLMRY